FRCGSKTDPNIQGTTHYLRITKNSGFVSTETIDVDGKRLCASLTTLELFEAGVRTRLRLTSQVASSIGQDMIKGHEIGNNASLDNLCRYFDKT
ncbi:MAG: SRPBCC domain-containing protein, partial [Methylophilaceae bacterium]|nr:SRPBCC domain-containing protein [Methylophilaceae bacterium]